MKMNRWTFTTQLNEKKTRFANEKLNLKKKSTSEKSTKQCCKGHYTV